MVASASQFNKTTGDLALLNIDPWQGGWGFYADWRNALGVFITTILISLGAPTRISEAALSELQRQHPETAELIEQAAGIGDSRGHIIDELDLILREEGYINRTMLVEEYARLLDQEHQRNMVASASQFNKTTGDLALLNIDPWQGGWGFYADWRNALGVFITTILISLGAPFWYDLLRTSVNLLRNVREKQNSA